MKEFFVLLLLLSISCGDLKNKGGRETSSTPETNKNSEPKSETSPGGRSTAFENPSQSGQNSSLANVDCSGKRDWEFGDKMRLGSLADESVPFIQGNPAGSCLFEPGEQEEIIKKLLKGLNRNAKPVAIFTIGGPGCGKSSSVNKTIDQLGLEKTEFLNIDPDALRGEVKAFQKAIDIKSRLCPGKKRAYAGATEWCLGLGRALKDDLLIQAREKKLNFIFDSACDNPEYCADLIQEAAHADFRVYVIAVWASKNKCLERATERAFLIGRYAEPSYIVNTHNSIGQQKGLVALIDEAKASGGRAFIYDSDDKEAKLVFEGTEHQACPKEQPACSYFFNK